MVRLFALLLAMSTHCMTHRPVWVDLDHALIRQLEVSILLHFPLWVPRAVEEGQRLVHYPDYWEPELTKIHRKAHLIEAYVTPDEHSVALGAFEKAFGCTGSESSVDDRDADLLGISGSLCPSTFSEQPQLPFFSTSPLVVNPNSDMGVPLPNHIGPFKTSLASFISSGPAPPPHDHTHFFGSGSPETHNGYAELSHHTFSPEPTYSPKSELFFGSPEIDNGYAELSHRTFSPEPMHSLKSELFFGSPKIDNGYAELTHGSFSPEPTHSLESTLGLRSVSTYHDPPSAIPLTNSGLSREGPILISDSPTQPEQPGVIYGSPPPHSFISWSSVIISTDPGEIHREHVHSHGPELRLEWRDYAYERSISQSRYMATIDGGIWA
jgi:hypothetical protein